MNSKKATVPARFFLSEGRIRRVFLMKIYFSTIADFVYDENGFSDSYKTVDTAFSEGTGIELTEVCLSEEMDRRPQYLTAFLEEKARLVPDVILHAPYNELTPAAIEPAVYRLTRTYLHEAYLLAEKVGAKKMVVHSGNVPTTYYPEWFIDRSIAFWKEFLRDHPGEITLCYENMLDTGPESMKAVLDGVQDERFQFCFDMGHALVNTNVEAVDAWIDGWGKDISHVHVHNNYGVHDNHNVPGDGLLNVEKVLQRILSHNPQATATVECTDIEGSVLWMKEHGFLK